MLCRKFDGKNKEELLSKIFLFYNGPKERTGGYGTGFIINAKMRKSFVPFEPHSDRLCKLRLRGKYSNITLISTYAQTEDSSDAIKDEFYDPLSK